VRNDTFLFVKRRVACRSKTPVDYITMIDQALFFAPDARFKPSCFSQIDTHNSSNSENDILSTLE